VMNYNPLQISEILQMNQFIVNKNIVLLQNIDINFLNKISNDLYQLDVKIKLSLIDKNKSLKYFLLKL
ncbi:MAG: hypothetical protein K2I36_03220, partial [Ureaplasma sp.]|nr:hypothetical protein [Ureaplasma sp.]